MLSEVSEVMGEVGPDPRRIEVIPETPPVRRAPPRPAPQPAPAPDREPERVSTSQLDHLGEAVTAVRSLLT
jgi:hypothetical protein